MTIEMISKPLKITKIKKPTKAKVFVDFKEGDLLTFTSSIANMTGASGGGNYASDVVVRNITKGVSVVKYQSELVNLLDRCFELEEVVE